MASPEPATANVVAMPKPQGQAGSAPAGPAAPAPDTRKPPPLPPPDLKRLAEIWPPLKVEPQHHKPLAAGVGVLSQISRQLGQTVAHQAIELWFRFDIERRKFARYDPRGLNAIQYGWAATQEHHDQTRMVVSWQPIGWDWCELATQLTAWNFTGRNWVGTRVLWPGTRQVLLADYPEGMPLVEHFRQIGWAAVEVNPTDKDRWSPMPLSPAAKLLADYGVRAFVVCRAAAIQRRLEGNETVIDRWMHRVFAISALLGALYATGGLFLGQ